MNEQRGFVSCFRINGRPILPPVMTPKRRTEMQEYRNKALAVEQRLKERKLLIEKKLLENKGSKNEKESPEENKENDEEITIAGSSKNMTNGTKEIAKPSLSERCLKEVPLQCNLTEPKLTSLICQEQMAPFDDLDYLEDEMCSVTPTESTDLQLYLDSTLEDVSPEVGSNFDCQESMQFKRRHTYFVAGHENSSNSTDPSLISSKVSALESKFVDVKFSPLVNLEKSITELFSSNARETISDKLEELVENIIGESAPACTSFNHGNPLLRNPEVEDQLLKNNFNFDCLNSRTSLTCEPARTELCEVIYPSKKLHTAKKHRNIPADTLEGVHVPPSHSSSGSATNDCVGAVSTSTSERNDREKSHMCSPPRLVRRGSYTLDSPSPILCANIEHFKVDTMSTSNSSETITNLTKDVIIGPASQDGAAISETFTISNKNTDMSSNCAVKDLMESVKICSQTEIKTSETEAKAGRSKIPCKKQLAQQHIKIPSTKCSVFERLAADGAKKAEERRKLTKESIFKVPGIKKVAKATKSQLRTAVSASNIRMSLTEAHRKRNGFLASRRCNSDVNIVSVAPGKCGQSGSLPQNMPNKQKLAKLKKVQSFGGNNRVIPSRGSANPDNLQRSQSVDVQQNKESTSNSDQHDSAASPKKQIYIVQTSPISPPCINTLIDDTADSDAAQRRRRRRWSENWDGWTNFTKPNCSTPPCDKDPPKIPESSKNIENSEILEKKIMARRDSFVNNSERKELCPGMHVNMFAPPKHGHQDMKMVKNSEPKEELLELCTDKIAKVTTAVEVIITPKKETTLVEGVKIQENETVDVEDIKTQENSQNKMMNLNGKNNFPEQEEKNVNLVDGGGLLDDVLLAKKEIPVITDSVAVCEVKKGLDEAYVNFPSLPEVAQCLQETVREISSHVSNVPSDLVQIYKKVEFTVENNASSNMSQASAIYSPSTKIPCDSQYPIVLLPETPLGPHGAKDMAFCLLRRLVEEQEKAMSQLLEEQRLQAENMQKKFKEQQKYLVGRLTHLVKNLPSPQINEATPASHVNLSSPNDQTRNSIVNKQGQFSERNASTPIIETDVNQSGVIHNNEKYVDRAISTPVHVFKEIAETNGYRGVSSASDISCSISPLSPSNFIQPSSISTAGNKISETREICDNDLITISLSEPEDFHRIICSLCQICHSPSNPCKCNPVNGSYSSTLKGECTTVDINSSEHIGFTSKYSNEKMEDHSTEERTVFQVSPSLIEKNNQSIGFSRSRDSNSSDMLKGMESSTMIEGSTVQNIDLDLSGILEMESREKNISFSSTEPLSAITALQDACCPGASSVNQQKIQMSNEEVINEVSLHRQKYEQDLWRLAAIEIHPISTEVMTKGDSHCVVKTIPLTTKRINLTSVVDCPISQRELSAMQDQNDKSEMQTYMQTELPDLRSDTVALRTYLGAQTPSTGPVTLETPISTPRYQSSESIASHLISEELLADKAKNNLSPEPPKEKVSRKDDAICPVALETPISTPRYESSESIVSHSISGELLADKAQINMSPESSNGKVSRKEGPRYPDLELMIEGSENEKKYECDSEEYRLPIRSPSGSIAGSSSERHFISDDSPSSGQYTTASSNSQNKPLVLHENELEILKKFSKLSALVRGYLTRRLLKTARVLNIKATIQDSLITALNLHSEVSTDEELNPADVLLHGQLLAQLTAACNELYYVCFELSVAQQMAIINADRKRLLSRTTTPIVYDADGPITPRPALLSAVTLMTLQRRFGNELSVKKRVGASFKSKPKVVKECSKVKVNALPEAKQTMTEKIEADGAHGLRPPRSRARSIHLSSYTVLGKETMSCIRKQSVGKGTEIKTSNVWVKPKVSIRKPRRSSSAGEINRKPWR